MLNTSDTIKGKAMEKLKSMSGGGLFGGSGDSKAQAWLDGFLRIPFGIYKENPIISFVLEFILIPGVIISFLKIFLIVLTS